MSSISFFNPQFFFALVFIAAVVLIHFLRRPRTVDLNFSTLRFFDQKAVLHRKTRNLRKLIQLLVRCAIAAVIITLFARPFNRSELLNKLQYPDTPVYLWIDHTLSMDYTDSGSLSIGQLSVNIADSLQKLLPASSKLFIYDQSGKNYHLKGQSVPFASGFLPYDLEDALDQVGNTGSGINPFVILFSDFQIPVKMSLEKKMEGLDKKITVICVPVTPSKPWNYSLAGAGVQVQNQNQVEISTQVRAQGKSLEKGEVVAETNRMRIGRVSVKIDENESSSVKITGNLLSGNSAGKLSLTPSDPLLFDNSAWFVPEGSGSSRVVIIGDRKRCLPIEYALKVSSGEVWNPVVTKEGSGVTFDELDSADLVIVNDLAQPSRALNAFLNYPAGFKRPLIFCCSVDDATQAGNAILGEILPSFSKYTIESYDTPLSPLLPDTTSQLWRHFQKIRCEDVSVYKRCGAASGDILLRLTDGSALMSKTRDKNGRPLLVLTTPLGVTDANNLSETGFFVPFVDRICRYMLSSDRLPKESFTAGRQYRNPYFNSGSDMSVFDIQSKLVKTVSRDQPFFMYDEPGVYKVSPLGRPVFFVAVQPDSAESVPEYVLPDTGRHPNLMIVSKERLLASAAGQGHTFFTVMLWVALAALFLIEMLLWERHSRFS